MSLKNVANLHMELSAIKTASILMYLPMMNSLAGSEFDASISFEDFQGSVTAAVWVSFQEIRPF